jgi:hypothetical protein
VSTALDDLHERFQHWFGPHYDLDGIDAALAAAAIDRLDGDPLWLLVVGGPGAAKTETLMPLRGCGGLVVSTISSDAALLSGTPHKERAEAATGGLLKQLGDHGVLVVKDLTSILSMHPNLRTQVLAALREIYDGHWVRDVGADGGRRLEWSGRIAVVGASTTAWDRAHAVVAQMGDRFVLLRINSTSHRLDSGLRAIQNTGSEPAMRDELAQLAHAVVNAVNPDEPPQLTAEETHRLLLAANLVTLARTAVDFDYRGDVVDAHAPEAPTRFGKQLAQLARGAIAIGLNRPAAVRLAIRCARDSVPPLRLAIIDDLAAHPHSTTTDVRKRLAKPRATVDRQLQALHMLAVVHCDEIEHDQRSRWYYSLADAIDPACLLVPEITSQTVFGTGKGDPTVKTGTNGHASPDDAIDPACLLVPEITSQTVSGMGKDPTVRTGTNGHASPDDWPRCACGEQLLHPDSLAAGHCARCRLRTNKPGALQ